MDARQGVEARRVRQRHVENGNVEGRPANALQGISQPRHHFDFERSIENGARLGCIGSIIFDEKYANGFHAQPGRFTPRNPKYFRATDRPERPFTVPRHSLNKKRTLAETKSLAA